MFLSESFNAAEMPYEGLAMIRVAARKSSMTSKLAMNIDLAYSHASTIFMTTGAEH